MRIIIAGGSGIIGKPLAEKLAQKGHEVAILSRDPSRITFSDASIRQVKWDGKSASGWGELADGAGVIINLAGENLAGESLLTIRWTRKRKERILKSRQDAGRAVVEAVGAAKIKPELVIQASAVGYYGPRDQRCFDEQEPIGSDFLAKVCQEWEASTQAVETMNVRRAVIRIGVVLSKVGGALPRQMLPFKFFVGGPIGNGKQGYPWVHLADVVGAIEYLVENPQAQGVYNLTAPNPVTNAEFGKALGKAMRRPALIPAPGFAFKLAFGEASTVLLDGQLPLPVRLSELGYKFQFTDVQAALQDLLN